MIREIWKDVPGYEGIYQVSNYGKVKSTTRYNDVGRFITGKILTPHIIRDGCHVIRFHEKGVQKSITVARLVLEVHCPDAERVEGSLAIHRDGNQDNNHTDNLFWSEKDTYHPGIRKPPEVVSNVKFLHERGSTQVSIARELGLSTSTVSRILTGRSRSKVK